MYKQQLFMCLLSVALLFTMGMDFGARRNDHSFTQSSSPVHSNDKEQLAAFHDMPLPQNITEQRLQSLESEQKRPLSIKPAAVQLPIANYEVTAYFLNVRANKNAASEILNVVKHGDVLQVLDRTENNWLKLKSGGFVHGKYAKLIDESESLSKRFNGNEKRSTESLVIHNEPTSTVKSKSKLTEEQIIQIFEGTSLANHGLEQTILETEQEYGINAYFTIAVMKLESGHGKSKLAKEKNNLFGLNAIDGDAFNKAYSFKTKGESVEKFGQLISENYIDKGYTSIEKVASKYCQANSKWSSLVKSIMKSDYNRVNY